MNKVTKKLLIKTAVLLPGAWLGLTLTATCITWWHGYAIYFIYTLFIVNVAGIFFVLNNYKNLYLLTGIFSIKKFL